MCVCDRETEKEGGREGGNMCICPSFPWWLRHYSIDLQCRRPRFGPWVRKSPWRRKWLATSVFLPGEFHEQRNLEGYGPWSHKESDITEQQTHTKYYMCVCARVHACNVASVMPNSL